MHINTKEQTPKTWTKKGQT